MTKNILQGLKKQPEYGVFYFFLMVVGIVLAGLLCVSAFSRISSDSMLSACFKKQGLIWENRAAEAAKNGIWDWKDSKQQQQGLYDALDCGKDLLGFGVVTDYQKTLSAPMTSSQSFVPVTSLTLRDGTALTMAPLGSMVFLTLEPGAANEEIVVCTAIDSTNKQFTGCTRGLAFSGTSTAAVSANQKTHSSGGTVVMSNVHYVYQQFLDLTTTSSQNVIGPVVYTYFPKVTSTVAIPTTGDQLANKYYVDSIGAGGFTGNNVSSTLGLQAINSGVPNCPSAATCVGINASSTGALNFYPGTGMIYVNASSTASDTLGGYIKHTFDSWNVLYWDAVSFLSGTHIWSGTNTFNSGTYVNTATYNAAGTGLAANDIYAFNSAEFSGATSTGSVAITIGQAVYMSATSSQILQTNTSVASSTFQFIGISASTTSAGQAAFYTKPGGINCGQTGLTPGLSYYLNGTNGQISTTPGTFFARIGTAITANCIQVMAPKYVVTGSFGIGGGVAATTTNVGFYPAHVELRAGCGGNGGTTGDGFSTGDETNTSVNFGYNGSNYVGGDDPSNAVHAYCNNAAPLKGTISARDRVSFTYTGAASAGVFGTLQYVVTSE